MNTRRQGFTILLEIPTTFVLESTGGDILDLDQREMASYAFKVAGDKLSRKPQKPADDAVPDRDDPESIIDFIKKVGRSLSATGKNKGSQE